MPPQKRHEGGESLGAGFPICMARSKAPTWLKRQGYLSVTKVGQVDRKKLLRRDCSKHRSSIPVMDMTVMSDEERKAYQQAAVIMLVFTQHAAGYQLTRSQLAAECRLSYRKLAAGLRFLKSHNLARFIPVRQNSRLSGWCLQVDLNGTLQPKDKAWALHYTQSEDVDRDYRTAKRRHIRRKAAGLAVTKPVRNAKRSEETVTPRRTSSERTAKVAQKRNALKGSPLASPIMVQPPRKKKSPLSPCRGIAPFPFPEIPDHPAQAFHKMNPDNQVRIQESIDKADTRMRADQAAVENWWSNNLIGQIFDLTLPPGASLDYVQKRGHLRRLHRTAEYCDLLAWHWAVTRQSKERPPASTLTTSTMTRLYSCKDPVTADNDKLALVDAYRRVQMANGAEWNQLKPRGVYEAFSIEAPHKPLSHEAMLAELADMTAILQEAADNLRHRHVTYDKTVWRYARLRGWVLGYLGGGAALAFDYQCRKAGLDPSTNDQLKQWFVRTSCGRAGWKAIQFLAPDAKKMKYITGHSGNEWDTAVDVHAAATLMLETAYKNLQWEFKAARDYSII